MPPARPLTADERAYFGLLAETVYSNPFGSDREPIARLLGRKPPAAPVSQAGLYGDLVPELDRRLAALAARGQDRLERFPGEDRELMRQVFLFRCYQDAIDPFDALIARQRLAPRMDADSGRVQSPQSGWIDPLLERLAGCGFEPAEAIRFVELYFQLRRAYFFIETALAGRSAPMASLRRTLWNSVFTTDLRSYALLLWGRMDDFSTLLLGETGTGKGSAAAAIGRSGPIPFDPRTRTFACGIEETFIATNLSELSEGLIESELFGHRKGAFTGAVDHHQGLFARCRAHGTLFLDEIGDVSLPVQTKLLRVLQDRVFFPVGSHEPQRFAGRVAAATNRSLDELLGGEPHRGADRGAEVRGRCAFRRDLFYRISSNIVHMPTLRERLADCPDELQDLVDTLLARMAGPAAGALRERVTDGLDTLHRAHPGGYPWPGNVRELEQAVRRIVLNGRYDPDPLPERAVPDPWLAAADAGRLDAAGLLAGYCRRLYARLGTIEAVARTAGLDRRTAKKHILAGGGADAGPPS